MKKLNIAIINTLVFVSSIWLIKTIFFMSASDSLYIKSHFDEIPFFISYPGMFAWFLLKYLYWIAFIGFLRLFYENSQITTNLIKSVKQNIQEKNEENYNEYIPLYLKKYFEKQIPQAKNSKSKQIKM